MRALLQQLFLNSGRFAKRKLASECIKTKRSHFPVALFWSGKRMRVQFRFNEIHIKYALEVNTTFRLKKRR
jgi:hypothetical protein